MTRRHATRGLLHTTAVVGCRVGAPVDEFYIPIESGRDAALAEPPSSIPNSTRDAAGQSAGEPSPHAFGPGPRRTRCDARSRRGLRHRLGHRRQLSGTLVYRFHGAGRHTRSAGYRLRDVDHEAGGCVFDVRTHVPLVGFGVSW